MSWTYQRSFVAGNPRSRGVYPHLLRTDLEHSADRWSFNVAPNGAVFVAPKPQPSGARVWFFTRRGGVSQVPYDSLNVSTRVGDDADAVARNLARISEAMDGNDAAWVRQEASDGIVRIHEPGFAGVADALVTEKEGLSLAVAVADCVPVALVGEREVGMIHSGWRGTLAGISRKAAREIGGASPRASYIGPCIRQCCYEVSEELAETFAAEFGDEVIFGRNLSLPGAVRVDLKRAGVEEIHDCGLCTGCRPNLFFSHRKQKPVTGRNLAAVARMS